MAEPNQAGPQEFTPRCPGCHRTIGGVAVVSLTMQDPTNPQGDPIFNMILCPHMECNTVLTCLPAGSRPRQVQIAH